MVEEGDILYRPYKCPYGSMYWEMNSHLAMNLCADEWVYESAPCRRLKMNLIPADTQTWSRMNRTPSLCLCNEQNTTSIGIKIELNGLHASNYFTASIYFCTKEITGSKQWLIYQPGDRAFILYYYIIYYGVSKSASTTILLLSYLPETWIWMTSSALL